MKRASGAKRSRYTRAPISSAAKVAIALVSRATKLRRARSTLTSFDQSEPRLRRHEPHRAGAPVEHLARGRRALEDQSLEEALRMRPHDDEPRTLHAFFCENLLDGAAFAYLEMKLRARFSGQLLGELPLGPTHAVFLAVGHVEH